MPQPHPFRAYRHAMAGALLASLLIGCDGEVSSDKRVGSADPDPGVELFAPTDPPTGNREPEISGAPPAIAPADQAFRFIPDARDLDGDTLTFSVANLPAWAQFDPANGELSGVPFESDAGIYPNIRINVTDGEAAASLPPFSIEVQESALTRALRDGDASLVDTATVYDAAVAVAEELTERCEDVLDQIYPAGPAPSSWSGGVDITTSTNPGNIPLHASGTRVHSWLGERIATGGRYAVFGGYNVFDIEPESIDLGPSTLQVLSWLTRGEPGTDVRDKPLVLVMGSDTDKRRFENWIDSNNIVHQWTLSTDTGLIASGDFDVFFRVFNKDELAIIDVFNAVLDQGKAVMGMPVWVHPDDAILAVFDLTWDWWKSGGAFNDFASTRELCNAGTGTAKILATITNLRDQSLAFVYTDEACPTSTGKTTCKNDLLVDGNGKALGEQFADGASAVRTQLAALDLSGTNVFSLGNDQRLLKLAVLLGDKLREDITYPMDKETTDDTVFYGAYFADHAVHYSRPNNSFQPDAGNYSAAPEVLSAQPTSAATYTATPTEFSEWTSTGFYAPPGTTITVRRTDSSSNDVQMRFNMLKNTVRLWNTNGYKGPKFQTSHTLQLQPNSDYTLSTPFGGPIYIFSEGVAENAQPFTVEFDGILRHPLLTDFSAASIQQYLTELEAGLFDWTDIKTPFVEVHSLTRHMLSAFARYDGNEANGYTAADVQGFISDLNTYLITNNYSFAGFADASLTPLNANVSAFCAARGLACTDPVIHRKPKVQHIVTENLASCGSLCSGNPFTSGKPLAPLGGSENHEMGHNLQRGRLKIYSGRSAEVSNNIFPVHVHEEWARDQGLTEHPNGKNGDHRLAFLQLQQTTRDGVVPSIDHPVWESSAYAANAGARLAFYVQLAYIHNSWDIYTEMYLMERIFTDAIKSDAKWAAAATNLGFSTYTREDAGDATIVDGNNFMYIAASLIDGRDFADYFEVWGIEISAEAKAQVQANGAVGSVPTLMYYVEDNKLFTTFPNTPENERPLDGVTSWDPPGTMSVSTLRATSRSTTATPAKLLAHDLALSRRDDVPVVAPPPPPRVSLADAPAAPKAPRGIAPTTVQPLDAPTVNVSPLGDVYFGPVQISFVCSDPDNDCQSIFYTLDGSPPTTTSLLFTAPFTLTESARLRFIAVDATGEVSPIVTEDYVLNLTAPHRVVASPPGGEFQQAVEVTLICEAIDNTCDTIFYTLDSTAPTTESLLYTGPITLEETTTLRYFGRDVDGRISAEGASSYDILVPPPLPSPTFSPAGGRYSEPVQISLACVDPDDDCVAVFYTLDGSEPTAASTESTGPFTLSETTIVRAIALDAAGNLGETLTEIYEIAPVTATPNSPSASAAPPGGNFATATQVTLTCTDPDDDCTGVRFTLDGSEPTATSPAFTAPLLLQDTATVRFFAFDAQGNRSLPVTEVYRIGGAPPAPRPPTVSATPGGGNFEAAVQVTLECFDLDGDCAAVFYALDGSEPTTASTEFTTPLLLNETTTVRFIAVDLAGNVSEPITEVYRIGLAPSAPVITATPATGVFNAPVQVTLSCTDPDDDCDSIFYTLDGSEPIVTSIEFTGPFVLNETTAVRAIATDLQGNVSPVLTQIYIIAINIIPAPGGVPENLTLWLKANLGTDATLDGNAVASWLDQSDGANNTVAAGSIGTPPSLELNELNFNPAIRFTDDGDRHLRTPTNPVTDDMSLIAVFSTVQTDGADFFADAPALISGQLRNTPNDWALGLNAGEAYLKAQSGGADRGGLLSGRNHADGLTHLLIGTRARGGTSALYVDGETVATAASDNASLNAPLNVGIGNHPNDDTAGQFDGDIAEAIVYSAVLSDSERQQIQSYLAIKYGLTLDQTSPRNYLDSAGNVIFDTAVAAGFVADIAGIGLDNASMLNQPRSRSSNAGSLVEIGNASDQQNGEFLVWGNDGGAIDATTPVVSGDRTLRRINRTWFVDKTGDPGTVDITISNAAIPALATLSPSESYRLLIANDPEFTNPQIIDVTSTALGAITAPVVNIDDNQYFTFGIE